MSDLLGRLEAAEARETEYYARMVAWENMRKGLVEDFKRELSTMFNAHLDRLTGIEEEWRKDNDLWRCARIDRNELTAQLEEQFS